MVTEIPKSRWIALFDAAKAFMHLAPWRWTSDADLFGVVNPDTGETGYCSVMGRLGDFLGMALYPGEQGLKAYELLNNEDDKDDSTIFEQHCLLISFREPEEIDADDLALLQKMGFSVSAGNIYPVFRSYQPGLYPWSLSLDELEFLVVALEQAMDVCKRLEKQPELLADPEEKLRVLVRKKVDGTWQDVLEKPDQSFKFRVQGAAVDKKAAADALVDLPIRPAIMLFEQFYIPRPSQRDSDPRPFFPKGLILFNVETQEIQGFAGAHPSELREEIPKMLLRFFRDMQYIPQQMVVTNDDNYKFLNEFTRLLTIELHLEKELDVLKEIKAEVFEMIGVPNQASA